MASPTLNTHRSMIEKIETAVDHVISAGAQINPLLAWITSVLAIVITGTCDYLTGSAVWLGPVYIIIVFSLTWILGARAGMLVGLTCFATGLCVNGASLYPYDRAAFVLNMALRLIAMTLVVMLIAAFRRSHDREWHSARMDHLTGAMTGPTLLEHAARAAARTGVLAYLDLDGFKAINDRFGHAAGDAVLRSFASQVSGQLRKTDLFARLGGDEFLIYVSLADASEAQPVVESLHTRLNQAVSWEGHRVGCSIGAVLVPAGHSITERDVAEADRLMYAAKRDGSGLRLGSISAPVERGASAHASSAGFLSAVSRWNVAPARSRRI